MNIQWDATGYTKNFGFVHQYGNDVLSLIDHPGGKSVLDLGCGNGALTQKLSELGAAPIGMDASEELLEIAKAQYPDLTFFHADATDFSLSAPVDAVFSNAVFHWIDQEKHPSMLACVAAALKPGGQFIFEFGGQGNNTLIHGALAAQFAAHGLTYQMPFYFPSIGAYAPLLEAAGFTIQFATLFDRPTPLNGPEGLTDYIHMFIKAPFQGLQHTLQEEIIDQAVLNLRPHLFQDGTWYSDYVRIRMKAKKHQT